MKKSLARLVPANQDVGWWMAWFLGCGCRTYVVPKRNDIYILSQGTSWTSLSDRTTLLFDSGGVLPIVHLAPC